MSVTKTHCRECARLQAYCICTPTATTKHDELVEEVAELLQRFGLGGGNNPSEEARGIIALIRRDERQRCVEAVEAKKMIVVGVNPPIQGAIITYNNHLDDAAKAIKELEL